VGVRMTAPSAAGKLRGMSEQNISRMAIAAEPKVVKRALAYAIVVGTILISINHGDALLRLVTHGERLAAGRLWRMGLTVLVPYAVSTFSSVSALRDARLKGV
jgi:hypothetical protein